MLLIVAGAALGWAGAKVFVPTPAVEDASYTLVTVEEGSVSGHVAVNTRAVGRASRGEESDERDRDVRFGLGGTRDHCGNGHVRGRPAAGCRDEGTTPAFRTMQSGDRGTDARSCRPS